MDIIEIREGLTRLYSQRFGMAGDIGLSVIELPQAGSDRRYFRLSGDAGSCIGTYAPEPDEGRCFISLAGAFGDAGRAVPAILAANSDATLYLQEDLGDRSLFSMLGSEDAEMYIKETLDRLVELQKTPEDVWKGLCMSEPFCRRQVMWDLNYFKYEFLKPAGVTFDENRLEDDFEGLAERLLAIPQRYQGFMMRDCQSRNVMMSERGPVFIDFQGGRRGPSLYDAVSFLWQARAGFDREFRLRLLGYYADRYCGGDSAMIDGMLSSLSDMVLFRTLQVLGAYGFRGLVQHRAHFILSIPQALGNLKVLLDEGGVDMYPELRRAAEKLVSDSRFKAKQNTGRLRVEVFSFSYKKGYPEDLSGNGGGFAFDCRAMHNPGRYPQYRSLTGRDLPVMEFLEKRGEVQAFLRGAWSLTDPAVERYIARGFSNIQISFGCTGGQHRSVYCAEATARHIRTVFPEADVVLLHREQSSGTRKS